MQKNRIVLAERARLLFYKHIDDLQRLNVFYKLWTLASSEKRAKQTFISQPIKEINTPFCRKVFDSKLKVPTKSLLQLNVNLMHFGLLIQNFKKWLGKITRKFYLLLLY